MTKSPWLMPWIAKGHKNGRGLHHPRVSGTKNLLTNLLLGIPTVLGRLDRHWTWRVRMFSQTWIWGKPCRILVATSEITQLCME